MWLTHLSHDMICTIILSMAITLEKLTGSYVLQLGLKRNFLVSSGEQLQNVTFFDVKRKGGGGGVIFY